MLAAHAGLTSRPFDSANPQLDLRLPDGSRLSAVMGVTARPVVSIRRARLGKVFLGDLVANGTMSDDIAAFLKAAVAARKNIMIAGATNAGKTTLLRALANEIPPHERLITVERSLELGLGEFPDLHPNVVAFEERLPNSEGVGEISMADLVRRSLRMNPSRVIVGEVLGDEIVTMLNAMSQGNDGSLSTIHSNSSMEVFNRICDVRDPGLGAAADGGHPDADRGRARLRRVHPQAQRLPAGRPAEPVRREHPRGDRLWTAGCCPARCSRPGRTAAPPRTRRSSASTSSRCTATSRWCTGDGRELRWTSGPTAGAALRRAGRRWPAAAHRGDPRYRAEGRHPVAVHPLATVAGRASS